MLLIQNGILHTMGADDPIQADLLIKNGKIAKIAGKILPEKGMRVINAEGLNAGMIFWHP